MPVTPFGVEVGILYRLTGPDGTSVSFNDSAQVDYVGLTNEITGLDGADTRESAELIVEGDGGIHGDFFHGRRPITLSGIIDPNSFAAVQNSLITNLLRASNAMRADATLSWTPSGGDPIAVKVRRQQPPRIAGQRLKTFQISLVAADPRLYGSTPRSFSRGAEASPGSAWGHAGDGLYDPDAAYALGAALHLKLDNSPAVGGLVNWGTFGAGGNGSAVGSPTIGGYTPGPLVRGDNTATDLNGSSQRIDTSYNPFTNGATRTFMGWAWRDNTSQNHALFGGSSANGAIAFIAAGSQDLYFGAQNSGHASFAAAWPGISQWVHWAIVFNETTNAVLLYINGTLFATLSTATAYHATPGNFQIGTALSSGSGLAWDGKVRSVSVFEYGLTADQIRWAYEEGARDMAMNRGNADSPVIMRIYGPITNPTIHNRTTGETMNLTVTVAGGDLAEINTATGEITNLAGASIYGMMNFTTSSWWDLKPGVNDFYLTGTGTTGATKLTLTYRDAWV